jgi:Cd2+/Zn2+-exporting ATPase
MERFITKFSRIYTPVVVAIAAITAVVPSLVTGDWNHWVYTALTFLVISCPCALVLSVPLSFFSGIGVGSKLGILFKSGVAMEALQNVKAVVMDKTGTITQGQFQVQEVKSTIAGKEMELLEIAACCEMTSTHPIATSIVMAAQDRGISIRRPEKVEEVSGMGVHAILDGKDVYCGNRRLMQEYQVTLPNEIQIGYGSEVYLAWDGVYQGHLRIADELKVDAKDSIAALKRQGLVPAMLTGDAQKSAMKVAQEVGIEEVYAKLLPENKVEVLEALRERYGSVMFVGDGMNDAPVLAGADVGAAMGSGSDAAIEAADVVFMTSSMEAIPQALDIAKQTNRIARQNIVFALVVKVAIMALGLLGFANMWMAVFADTGVALICIFNAMRLLYRKKK